MKVNYFCHFLFYVSIFGLCSCNSDNTRKVAEQKDPWSIASAYFVHTDKSRHSIGETLGISPQSRIEMNFSQPSPPALHLQSESICYSSKNPYPEYLHLENINVNKMSALKLLPIAIFKPHSQNEKVHCDFKITAKNGRGSRSQFDLNGLKIKNFAQFFNYNPLDLDSSQGVPTVYLKDILERKIEAPKGSYQTHLLCEKDYFSVESSGPMIFHDLVRHALDDLTPLQLCRIASTSRDQKTKHIGPIFLLQKEQSKVSAHIEIHLAKGLHFNSGDDPIVTIKLANKNDTEVYIDFDINKSRLKVQPITHAQAYRYAWYQHRFDGIFHWKYEEAHLLNKKTSHVRLKIAGNSSTIIQGFTPLRIQCPQALRPKKVKPKECPYQYTLWGWAMDFVDMPIISQSRMSVPDSKEWKVIYDLNTKFANKSYQGMSLWSASTLQHKCSRWIKDNEYPRMPNVPPRNNLQMTCDWY